MRGDVEALSRIQSRDRRYDLICKRLQRKLQQDAPRIDRGASGESCESGSPLGQETEAWPVKPRAFACRDFVRGGQEHAETLGLLKDRLLHHKTGGRHAFYVAELHGGVFVAPKRKLACDSAPLFDELVADFGAAAVSTHSVPLFHMGNCEVSPFPAFDAPDGSACLGVVTVRCQDHVTLYALCDATVLPLASPRILGIDTSCYNELQSTAARVLRLVATPCPRGRDGFELVM